MPYAIVPSKLVAPLGFGMAALLIALGSTGCARINHLRVDAISSSKLPGDAYAYWIRSGHPAEGRGDSQFDKAADWVRAALSGNGWYEAAGPETADQIIEIDFGISGPIRHYVLYQPRSYAGVATTVGVNTKPKSSEWITIATEVRVFMRLTAYEAQPASKKRSARQLWSVFVFMRTKDENPLDRLPILAAAAMDHVNKDTSGEIQLELRENDAAVLFVQSGL